MYSKRIPPRELTRISAQLRVGAFARKVLLVRAANDGFEPYWRRLAKDPTIQLAMLAVDPEDRGTMESTLKTYLGEPKDRCVLLSTDLRVQDIVREQLPRRVVGYGVTPLTDGVEIYDGFVQFPNSTDVMDYIGLFVRRLVREVHK